MRKQKLTPEQINDLFTFCEEQNVYHYDVQVELVDHLACAIEQKWEEEPSFSYDEALWAVFDDFGVSGFRKVKSAKEKQLSKKYSKLQRSYFLEFFKLPKIILTIALVYALFLILNYSGNFIKASLIIVGIQSLFMIGFLSFFYPKKLQLHTITDKSFLLFGIYRRIKWMSLILVIGAINAINFSKVIVNDEAANIYQWQSNLFLASLLALFFIGSIVMSIYVPRRIKKDFIREYPQFVKA